MLDKLVRSENNLSERLNTNVATITTKISTKFFIHSKIDVLSQLFIALRNVAKH